MMMIMMMMIMMMAATIWQSEKPHYTKKPHDTQLKPYKNKQALTRLW